MATAAVKNNPDELYEKRNAAAEINRRSINSQIIACTENEEIHTGRPPWKTDPADR